MKPRSTRSGIALLEVMIALLIMAMSAAAIAAALSSLNKTGALLFRQKEDLLETINLNRLQEQAQAIPPSFIPKDDALFVGTSVGLSFYSTEPGREAPQKIGVFQEGQILYANTKPIAKGIKNLTINYYGQPDSSSGQNWYSNWESQNLPSLVKLDWENTSGAAQIPLILEPGLNAKTATRALRRLLMP
jgi:type II secretory pathway pseudopilin PulG